MDKLVEIAAQYGPLGLMVLACFIYILKKDKDHKEERKELTTNFERQHKESLEVTKNNTTVLTEISVLIRNRKN